MAATVADQGRPLDNPVLGQVVHGEMAAPCQAVIDHAPRQIALVEKRFAFPGQGLEAIGQFRHPMDFAVLEQGAVPQAAAVKRQGLRCRRKNGFDHGQGEGLQRLHRGAVTRRRHRRFDQSLKRQGTEVVVGGEQPLDHARCGNRTETDVEFLGCRAEVGVGGVKVDIPGRPGPLRRLGEEVVEHRLTASSARHQKTAAAEGGQHRLGDASHAQAGQRRVEGVAAITQYAGGGLGGGRIAGDDDAGTYFRCSVRRGIISTKLHGP